MKKYLLFTICFFLFENIFSQNMAIQNSENNFGFVKGKTKSETKKAVLANFTAFGTLYEFGGISFDIRFKKNQINGLGANFGISNIINRDYVFYDDSNNFSQFRYKKMMVIPLGLNYLIGKQKHHIETGIELFTSIKTGYTTQLIAGNLTTKKATKLEILPSINIGYRFQTLKNGIAFNTLLKPIYYYNSIALAFSIGLGYGF
jgi:hypothetical protein